MVVQRSDLGRILSRKGSRTGEEISTSNVELFKIRTDVNLYWGYILHKSLVSRVVICGSNYLQKQNRPRLAIRARHRMNGPEVSDTRLMGFREVCKGSDQVRGIEYFGQ